MKSLQHHIVRSGVLSVIVLLFLFSFQTSYSQTTETFTIPGADTWLCPVGVITVTVECWGAGGGGGSQTAGKNGSGGGGGGGYSYSTTIAVTPGLTYNFSVGIGGTFVSNNPGNPGGDTYFINSTTILARGGGGGARGTNNSSGAGGLGAALGIGDNINSGGNGGSGNNDSNGSGGGGGSSAGPGVGSGANGTIGTDANSNNGNPGVGGTAPTGGGDGGNGGDRANGTNGSAPGGGAGGAGESSTGGNGGNGKIVLIYTPGAACNLATSGLTNITCDPNGTPSNPNDDVFYFDLNPTGTGLGSTYSITGGATVLGNSYGLTNFGPYPISGGNLSITITDDTDGSCTIAEIVTAPDSCSTTCNLASSGLTNITCNDGGTAADASDDVFYFDLNPTGTNLHGTYSISGAITLSGISYGNTNFGPYLITGGDLNITITDDADGSCTIGETVNAPPHCSAAVCNLASAGLANITCDDNGTPTIPGDDTFSFDLNPSGTNLGATYNITGDVTLSGISYGTTNFGPYPIAGGNLNITITDDADGSCQIAETVNAPVPCSIPICDLTASGLTNITCNDNGTPADPDDDTFSFDLNPTGTDLGASYSITGDVTQSGISYGITNFGPFTITGGNLNITLTDVSTDCAIIETVTAPVPCSLACNLTSSGLSNLFCNDQGTLSDPSDDTFSFTLNPTGTGLIGTYSVTGNITRNTISYDQDELFGPYLISGGDKTITITDVSDGSCQIVDLLVTAPDSCAHSFTECSSCHITHSSPGTTLTTVAGNALLCQSCHASGMLADGKPLVDGNKAIPGVSGNSHSWNVPAENSTYQVNTPTDGQMSLRLPDGNIVCSTCHNQHNNGAAGSPYLRVDNTGDTMCKTCHLVRDVQRFQDGPTNKGSHPVGITYGAISKLNASPTNTQLVGGKVECSSCHGVHDVANSGELTTDGNLLRTTNNNSLCQDCHNYTGHNGFNCNACHEVHNTKDGTIGNNIFMIRDVVQGSSVKFYAETGPNSFVDKVAPYDGICEVCHSSTKTMQDDGDNPLHDGDNSDRRETSCVGCHFHKDSFTAPSGPQTCLGCHSTAQTATRELIITRPVAGTVVQIVGTGGEYDNGYPSRHTTSNIGFDPLNEECEACHFDSGTTHPTSAMSLRDPDAAAVFIGSDTDVYCVKCHDGTAPTTPVDFSSISNATYNKASFIGTPHDTGDNSCLSCHERHGSSYTALTKQATNYEKCFACHDGGVSSINIDIADIATPGTSGTGHAFNVVANSGLYQTNTPSDPTMAARLDSGNIVCATCHDPHNNENTKFLVNANDSDQMCKDCHSARDVQRFQDGAANKGSHPVGVAYTGIGNVRPTPTGSVVTVGGNVECSSCHQPHNAATSDGNLLRQTNDNTLCTDCHNYQPHQGFGCLVCHEPHSGGNNIMLLRDVVNGSNVVFNSQGTTATPVQAAPNSFSDGDATRNGICEVCHTITAYHTGNADDLVVHNDGKDCTGCHSHNGLPPPADPQILTSFPNGSCHDCHESTGPGDPQEYPLTGAHEIHAGALYEFKCSECHWGHGSGGTNEGGHSSGGAVDVVFNPTGLASRFGLDAATPTWNGQAAGTCSNIYCHSNGESSKRGDINGSGAEAGVDTWSGDAGLSFTPIYKTTPAWNGGTIPKTIGTGSGCDYCHPNGGKAGAVQGLFTAPYTYTAATAPAAKSMGNPGTGAHTSTGAHEGNSGHYTDNDLQPWNGAGYDDGWPEVMCFWCHNADNNHVNSTEPKLMGTYSTPMHVDGKTWFNPYNYDPNNPTTNPIGVSGPGQGTMAPGLNRSSGAHCSSSQSCW